MRISLVLLFLLAVAGVLFSTLRWRPDREEGGLIELARRSGEAEERSRLEGAWPPPPTHPIERRPVEVEKPGVERSGPPPEYANLVLGRVLDGEGNPVAGARALVWDRSPEAEARRDGSGRSPPEEAAGAGLTDEEGRFELRGVPPNDLHRIGIRHPEYACARVTDVRVAAEGVTEVGTITLQPATRLHGVVRDSATRAVAGARLRLIHDPRTACEPLNVALVETRSDDEGRYEFPHASPCQGTIVVEAEGCANLQLSGLASRLRSGREVQLDLTLAPPRRIAGVVTDLDGVPIASARIVAGLEPWRKRYCSEVAESGVDGRFELSRLTAGEYSIIAAADGYRIVGTKAHTDETGVRLELLPLRVVCGRVVSEEGVPLQDFHAWLRPAGDRAPGAPRDAGDRSYFGHRFSDTDGRFELQDILYGPCVVRVGAAGYVTGSSRAFRLEGNTPVTGIVVRLVRLGSIAATAVGESGEPIPGARLTVWYARGESLHPSPLLGGAFERTGRITVSADETGRCEVRDLPEGFYGLRIEAEGFAEHVALDVPVRDGVERDLGRIFLGSGER